MPKPTHGYLVHDDEMHSYAPAQAEKTMRLFEIDPTNVRGSDACVSVTALSFAFISSATNLPKKDLESCIDLVEVTSGEAYKASSIGWSRSKKLKEMRDKDMMYILIRRADTKKDEDEVLKNLHITGKECEKDEKIVTRIGAKRPRCDDVSSKDHEGSADIPLLERSRPSKRCKTRILHNVDESGSIVGFISFMYSYDDPPHEDREVVYIYEIHLDGQLRGRGLGSRLIRFVEEAAQQAGISKTMLTVFASNTAGKRFYEGLGYVKDACSPKHREVRKRIIEPDYVIMSNQLSKVAIQAALDT